MREISINNLIKVLLIFILTIIYINVEINEDINVIIFCILILGLSMIIFPFYVIWLLFKKSKNHFFRIPISILLIFILSIIPYFAENSGYIDKISGNLIKENVNIDYKENKIYNTEGNLEKLERKIHIIFLYFIKDTFYNKIFNLDIKEVKDCDKINIEFINANKIKIKKIDNYIGLKIINKKICKNIFNNINLSKKEKISEKDLNQIKENKENSKYILYIAFGLMIGIIINEATSKNKESSSTIIFILILIFVTILELSIFSEKKGDTWIDGIMLKENIVNTFLSIYLFYKIFINRNINEIISFVFISLYSVIVFKIFNISSGVGILSFSLYTLFLISCLLLENKNIMKDHLNRNIIYSIFLISLISVIFNLAVINSIAFFIYCFGLIYIFYCVKVNIKEKIKNKTIIFIIFLSICTLFLLYISNINLPINYDWIPTCILSVIFILLLLLTNNNDFNENIENVINNAIKIEKIEKIEEKNKFIIIFNNEEKTEFKLFIVELLNKTKKNDFKFKIEDKILIYDSKSGKLKDNKVLKNYTLLNYDENILNLFKDEELKIQKSLIIDCTK